MVTVKQDEDKKKDNRIQVSWTRNIKRKYNDAVNIYKLTW